MKCVDDGYSELEWAIIEMPDRERMHLLLDLMQEQNVEDILNTLFNRGWTFWEIISFADTFLAEKVISENTYILFKFLKMMHIQFPRGM